jgi:ABC-type amino acid transport substrate-binding protein
MHAPTSLLLTRRTCLVAGIAACTVGSVSGQTDMTDLARIRASGVLKVAVYKANPPFSDGPAQAMEGLDVALAAALAKELGLRLVLLPFDAGENMNDDLRNMVWRGHYLGYGPADVMLQVPVDRHLMNENRQVLIFAPYLRQMLMVLHDTRRVPELRSADDLKGLPLVAERGSGAASVLMGHAGGLLRDRVAIVDTGVQAAQAVADGKAAAAYVTRAQAESVMFRQPADSRHLRLSELQLPGMLVSGWPVGLAIKAGHKELGQALEAAMHAVRSRGEMQTLFRTQGLTLTAP